MNEEAERLYERARELDPDQRAAFLAEACADDPNLFAELTSLLEQADAAEGFFDRLENVVLPSIASDSTVGQTVGHYRILSHLGSGGMGIVYRAQDTRLDREVALKFLPPHQSPRLDAADQLFAEARAAAALQHPNICVVHDIGETDDGRPFIAMALCDGETLKERLGRGPMPVEDAVTTAQQIARGLAAAHARRIVHRDVKPGNVMLDSDGTVKLLDFGIARMMDVTVTGPGTTPGTIAYMSPEQVRGDTVDAQTDLWALGVVLYEMLTGTRPFRGGNDRVVINSILHDEPHPLNSQRTEIPESLARIVERLLRKDPNERYGSASAVATDLASVRNPKENERVVRRSRAALYVFGALVVTGLSLTGFLLLQNKGSAPASGASEASIAVLPLANVGGNSSDIALGDGITEELIAALSRIERLRVIARTSAFAFRNRESDVRAIADSLRVSNLLEGSFQRAGSRLRVQIRLVDVRDGSTRWSQTYDREIEDIFAVQSEIARAVAGELELRLGAREVQQLRRGSTRNIAAYELYLRGRDPVHFRSDSGAFQGLALLEQAVALDPNFAAAYANMPYMYARLAREADANRARMLKRLADSTAQLAIKLDPLLPDAHTAVGITNLAFLSDLTEAEAAFRRAIDLGGAPRVRERLAQVLRSSGRPTEGLAESMRAAEEDPLSATAAADLGLDLCLNRRYDEGLARLASVATVRPPLLRIGRYLALCHAMKGTWPEAIAELRRSPDKLSGGLLGFSLARSGALSEARNIQADLFERWRKNKRGAFEVAEVAAGLRDYDQAFEWLDRSVDDLSLQGEIMYPLFADLHADPRFERLTRRMGLQKR